MSQTVAVQKPNRRRLQEAENNIQALARGTVADPGAYRLTVGRQAEVESMTTDLRRAAEGGGGLKVAKGGFGSGKTHFGAVIKTRALESGFVSLRVEFQPGTHLAGKCTASVYRELMASASTRACPERGAVAKVMAAWASRCIAAVVGEDGVVAADPDVAAEQAEAILREVRASAHRISDGLSNSRDFIQVASSFVRGHLAGEETVMRLFKRTGRWEVPNFRTGAPAASDRMSTGGEVQRFAVDWMSGEYDRVARARQELGVDSIPDHTNWYSMLKCFAALSREAGYAGLFITFDELQHLLTNNSKVRAENWNQILTMYNEASDGVLHGVAMLFLATTEAYGDPRAGMISYQALRSRLAASAFGRGDKANAESPLIELRQLDSREQAAWLSMIDEEHRLYVHHKLGQPEARPAPASVEAAVAFLDKMNKRVAGATPRDIGKAWVDALQLWARSPERSLEDIVGEVSAGPLTSWGDRAAGAAVPQEFFSIQHGAGAAAVDLFSRGA